MNNSAQPSSAARRIQGLYGIIFIIGAVFAARLFYLQIIQHDYYRAQALSSHQSKFTIPAERGRIFGLDGSEFSPLVLNQNQPTIYADPTGVSDIDATAQKLAEILDMETAEVASLLSVPETRYSVIKKRVNPEVADAVSAAELDGIGIADSPQRIYPEGNLAAHILGFVGADGSGQYGVEQGLDELLSGQAGRLEAVTDAFGIPLASNEDNIAIEARDGQDVILSIDVNIQKFAEDALREGLKSSEADSGSVIVMDPQTGAVRALANFPTFSPAEFNEVASEDYGVFINDVVSTPLEYGSGVKVFTMAAGLNEGAVQPDTTYVDQGFKQVDDRRIENALGGGGIVRSMTDVIASSINTGVIEVLERLGGGQINERGRTIFHQYLTDRFGFGANTGIELANEQPGVVARPDEGEGLNVRFANMTFGQGMTMTMLQMSAALTAAVNGGDYYQPTIVHATDDGQNAQIRSPKVLRSDIISDQTSSQLRAMMEEVVDGGSGRGAYREGYSIGGKTGTAQVLEADGSYSADREIGSFFGFGGSDEPQYVIMVRVDEPQISGFAGTVAAAPIFAEISNYLIDYYQIPPRM